MSGFAIRLVAVAQVLVGITSVQVAAQVNVRQIAPSQACGNCEIQHRIVATIRDDSVPGSISRFSTVLVTSDKRFVLGGWVMPYLANSSGYVIRQIGRKGRGPGEYVGPTIPFETSRSYYIADRTQRRITRLSKSFEFESSVRVPLITGFFDSFDDGRYFTSVYNPTRTGVGHPFHLVSSDGESVFSFGGDHLPLPQPRPSNYSPPRIALSGDTIVWVVHADHYRIERWTTKGERVAVYERPNPWLPTRPPASINPLGFRVYGVRVDQSGLLWIQLMAFGEKKVVVEALDMRALAVVASSTLNGRVIAPARTMKNVGSGYFGYEYREAQSGEPLIDVFAFEIVRK